MKIHEYQAKKLFRTYNIPIPRGGVAASPEEACQLAQDLQCWPLILKAQIHAGGRGKAGGIRTAHSLIEVKEQATQLLGARLITPQTGPQGRQIKKILVEEAAPIARELYLSIFPDRTTARIVIMTCANGGMSIEETAATTPAKIIKLAVDLQNGLTPQNCRELATSLLTDPTLAKKAEQLLADLFRLFVDSDGALLEINPLAITTAGEFIALDAKVEIDDNALFRQAELLSCHDPDQQDPLEVEAARHNLNYIRLHGTIGNMVNGAGLAMATMDLINRAGALPANFLDVGGGANAQMIENGFKIILADPQVKAILVNIFGGILRCDVLAQGLIQAARRTDFRVPVVIRLAGTNAEQGQRLLAEAGLSLIVAQDLRDAAAKVTELASGVT